MKISLKSCILAVLLAVLALVPLAGLAEGTVSGTVWIDTNADGVLDDKGYCLESYIDEEKQYAWSVAYTN